MRDYSVGRGLCSLIEVVCWICVVVGIVAAFTAAGATNRGFGTTTGMQLIAAIPGLFFALLSLIGVALTQIGRAGIDGAEYAQQGLKIARDQLDVSRQAMKQDNAAQQSFADLVQRLEEAREPVSDAAGIPQSNAAKTSYASAKPAKAANNELQPAPYDNQLGVNAKAELLTYDIKGKVLTQRPDGTFDLDGKQFATMDEVNQHLRL